jgi:ribose transport system permease protein
MSNSLSDPERVAVPLGASPPVRRRRTAGPYAGIILATCVLFVLSAVLVPKSLSVESVGAMLPFWAILAIMSAGQTLVIQQRGIDLSVPGVVSLAAMGFVVFVDRNDTSVLTGFAAVAVTAVVVGLVNGLIVTRVNVTPLITTLAVNALLVGVMFSYTQGVGSAAPASLQRFAAASVLGVSTRVWLAVGVVAVVGVVLRQTAVGRRFVAVGANPDAARATGIRVDFYVVGAYVAASAVAALFLTQLGQIVLTLGANAAVQLLVQALAMAVALAGAAVLNRRRGRLA